jgi:hypothetical protein
MELLNRKIINEENYNILMKIRNPPPLAVVMY